MKFLREIKKGCSQNGMIEILNGKNSGHFGKI